jgi:hypothetical protein
VSTTAPATDAVRDREAAEVRAKFPGWVVIWLGRLGEFRAYRQSATLSGATAEETTRKIRQFSSG